MNNMQQATTELAPAERSLAKRIPYGVADYGRIRKENAYYVDKTHFIPAIEAAPFYLFCIRPRRIGKSLWLSVLQHYYDVNRTEKQLKIYLFIDEYDHFANKILSHQGKQAYHNIVYDAGFFCHFFSLLKGATGGQISSLYRMFITGMSPITMDSIIKSFNIGKNISLNARFNEIMGFTEADVIALLRYYEEHGLLHLPTEMLLDVMKIWHNDNHIGEEAKVAMFSPDMVLYFINMALILGSKRSINR